MEPHIGSEQGGTRPVVVLQNDVGNRYAPTLIVATVTSRTEKKRYQPTHVLIAHNTAFEKPSVVQLEQIFTIDKSRVQRFLGRLTQDEMQEIEKGVVSSLDLNELFFKIKTVSILKEDYLGEENLNPRDAYRVMLRDYPDVLNIDQMCEILSVSTKTGYALLKKGSVQHLKVGRSYRIPKAHLLTYLIGFAPGHTIRA